MAAAQGVAKYTSASIVLLLIHGGPLDVSWAQQSPRVSAIVTAHYPGQVNPLPPCLLYCPRPLYWRSTCVLAEMRGHVHIELS